MHIAVNTKTAPFPLLFIFLTRPKRTPTAAQPLLLQLSHFKVGRNGIVFSGYKSQRTTEQKRGNKRKNWGEEQEQRKKRKPRKKQNPNREHEPNKEKHRKRRKNQGATQRGVVVLPLFSSPQTKKKPRIKRNSQQADLFIILLASKVAEKTKGKRRQSEQRRKIKGSNRRESISTASVFGLQQNR